MGKYTLVVTSSALDGQDDEYNAWYDTTHMADLLAIPGVQSGRRLEVLPISPQTPPGRYLAIYEIEIDDPAELLDEMGRRRASGQMEVSPALDFQTANMWLYHTR